MTIDLVTVKVPDSTDEVLQEKVKNLIRSFCVRMSNLSESEQHVFVDELNHFVTFYDPEHLIRP